MNRDLTFVRDATRLAGAIALSPLSGRSVRALGDEANRPLPGDELLPGAKGRWTHAITIDAGVQEIWPWLAQMGCRRAGWYSYDALDNGGEPSLERIVRSWQQVAIGAVFPWTPTANDGFVVKAVQPERYLVLGGEAGTRYRVIWTFVLEPIDETHTRLLTRVSGDYTGFGPGLYLHLVAHPLHFGMERRQLCNIKRRAEHMRRRQLL